MIRVCLSQKSWLTYAPPAMEQQGHSGKLHPEAWCFLSSLEDVDSSHVVLAYRKGLEGFLRLTLTRRELFAQGTWVHPEHRRLGTAILMWETALERLQPRTVYADLVSEGGRGLFRVLRLRHPEIEFRAH